MSAVTPVKVGEITNSDIYTFNNSSLGGTGSIFVTDANANLYCAGNSNFKKTLIQLTNGDFNVTGTGTNQVNFNLNGAINLTSATSGLLTSTAGTTTVSNTNTTNGQSILSCSSNSTSVPAILVSGSSATGGGVSITSAGPGAGSGSVSITATNSTTGQVQVVASGTANNALLLSTPNGGISATASGPVNITTSNTASGVSIATGTAGVPVTIGTSTSTISLVGNIVTQSATWNEFKPTNVTIYDNIVTVNTNPAVATGGDAGLAIRRSQLPNGAGTGDVVASTVPRLAGTFGTGSATPGTLKLDPSTASFATNAIVGYKIKVTSGTGINQVRTIKTFTPGTQVATIYVTADNTTTPTFSDGLDLVTAPASGDTYELYEQSYQTLTYNEVDDCFETRSALIDPGSTTVNVGNFTPAKHGATEIKPLSYNVVRISASGSTITVTLPQHGMATNDWIRVANPVVASGTLTAGTYQVTVLTSSSFTFVNPGGAVTTNTSSNLSVTLLSTSTLTVNKIVVQDPGYNSGIVSITGGTTSTTLALSKVSSGTGAGINIPTSSTVGNYLLNISCVNGAQTGSSGIAVISTYGTSVGSTTIFTCPGSDGQKVGVAWTGGAQPILYHETAGSGAGNYNYKVSWQELN